MSNVVSNDFVFGENKVRKYVRNEVAWNWRICSL